jgi:periplasmic protein TonB
MNGAFQTASPFLDEPWRRLVWIAPLSLAIWVALLLGFALLLKQTAPPLPEMKPIEARIVELPPVVGGLQGGAALPHPLAPAPPKPKPHLEVRRKVMPPSHPHKERIIPEAPPSLSGTRKAPAESSTAASKATTGASAESGAAPPAKESTGGGSGLGSDSLGARAIYSPVPKIPDELRDTVFQAEAVAHFEVSYEGNVKVTLAKPTPDPRLNQILLSTLEQWRFFPAMKGGVAIDSAFDVRIPISVQ